MQAGRHIGNGGLQADAADDILRDGYGDASMRSEADV